MQTETTYDLASIAEDLTKEFTTINQLFLFGSRRHKTKSPRSDVDILVVVTDGQHVRATDLRLFARELCPALDPFLFHKGDAVSCANDSFIPAPSLAALCERLDAVRFWSREDGLLRAADIEWEVVLIGCVSYPPTIAMPPDSDDERLQALFARVEAKDIPTKPFIGRSLPEVSSFLADIMRRVPSAAIAVNEKKRGQPQLLFNTEYCYQDLFFLVVKPWLPTIDREPFQIEYDGQKKSADFSVCKGRIVIEMKHVKDANTKAAVVKTLDGLASFYKQNPKVEVLLFAVFVAPGVEVDTSRWC